MRKSPITQILCLSAIMFFCGCGAKDAKSKSETADANSESSSPDVPKPLKHPVFATPVSRESPSYPAVQVDVLDADETPFLTTAELYLSLQSSRFPDQTRVLLPVNVGDFGGVTSRFVVLPFEPVPGDEWIINLVDDDDLTDEEEAAILAASRVSGFCVWKGVNIYATKQTLAQPARVIEENEGEFFTQQAEILGKAVAASISSGKFDNYGSAKYVVPSNIPRSPRDANKLTILDGTKARANLRIYFQDSVPRYGDSA